MAMTDPVADMLTRIRNGLKAGHKTVTMPSSNFKTAIAAILKEEGYIKDCKVKKQGKFDFIDVSLKYYEDKPVITNLKRESRPGRRLYVDSDNIPRVLNGLGVAILSTSKGVVTGKKAKELKLGGEYICSIY